MVPFPRSSAAQYLIFVNDTSDPIFFLLHGQLDRAWAEWQAHDRRNRKAIAGGVDQDLNNFNAHPLGIGTPVTRDTVIYMAGIGPDARVNDVLSTTEGHLCYQYDHV
jgi:tyrosinase